MIDLIRRPLQRELARADKRFQRHVERHGDLGAVRPGPLAGIAALPACGLFARCGLLAHALNLQCDGLCWGGVRKDCLAKTVDDLMEGLWVFSEWKGSYPIDEMKLRRRLT